MTQASEELLRLAERLESVGSGMRGYGLSKIAWNKSMDLRPSDLFSAAAALRSIPRGNQ